MYTYVDTHMYKKNAASNAESFPLAPPAPFTTLPILSIRERQPPFLLWGQAPGHLLDLHLFRGVILLFNV
jgi:hypothetical protein